MIETIHERLVLESHALTRPNPYAVFLCSNVPSMGFLSPGLIWLSSIAFEGPSYAKKRIGMGHTDAQDNLGGFIEMDEGFFEGPPLLRSKHNIYLIQILF